MIVLGLIIGYSLYPAFNDKAPSSSSYEKVTKAEKESRPPTLLVENSKEKVIQQKNSVSHYQVIPEKSSQITRQKEESELPITSDVSDDNSLEYSFAKEELINWSITHKNKLKQVIDENMPKSISTSMMSSLVNNNIMLNDPTVKQDSIEDDTWVFLMEQKIRAHITQHNQSAGFDILNVSCKQLICDVVGIEREAYTWFEIYRGFYSFPNISFPKEGQRTTNITKRENGISYIYAQIIFQRS